MINLGGVIVRGNSNYLAALIEPIEILYQAGHTKSSIQSGRYHPKSIIAQGESAWAKNESKISPQRGKPIFELALFLAQKELEEE